MKKTILIVLVLSAAAAGLWADGPLTGLFAAADQVATDLPRTIDGEGDLLLGGVTYNSLPVSLGDLFADLSANRLTGRSDFSAGVVKWYASPAYPPAKASWVLTGNIYAVGDVYLLTVQVLDNSDGSQVAGWEFVLSDEDVDGLLSPSAMASAGGWDAFEPNNSIDEAPVIELPFSAAGLSLAEGDEDWFAIEVGPTEDGTILLMRAATGGSMDTYMELYSPEDYSWPVSEDDDTDGGNAAIERPLNVPGTWYLKVRAFDSSEEGEYDLSIEINEVAPGPGEPDEGVDAAGALNVGQPPITRRIDYTGDVDWFRIVLTRPLGGDEVLRVETLGDGDTMLELMDEYQQILMNDDDSGADSNAMVMVPGLAAGTYYAVISGYSGSLSEYGIMANITVPVRDEFEDDNTMETASTISIGEVQRRNFSPVGDEDWVKFTITEEGYYGIRTQGYLDTYMDLYDGYGGMIESNDDAEDYNAAIERRFTAGDYYARVTPYGNAGPDDIYSLVLEELE